MALITIYEDNQGVIKLADNPVNHPKTKHIAVHYHAIQGHIANGEIQLEYLLIDWMIADGLTKATNHITQEQLVAMMTFFILSLNPETRKGKGLMMQNIKNIQNRQSM